jgi:ribonucleoside-triphosphate reductase
VRKSFYKHYIDGLKYIDSPAAGFEIKLALSDDEAKDISIEDTKIYSHTMAYNYALDMTKKEVHQGVEGLFHNLNTLQSRSGN